MPETLSRVAALLKLTVTGLASVTGAEIVCAAGHGERGRIRTIVQHKTAAAALPQRVVYTLEFFQGSPRKIIFDNLKAAVISGSGRTACLHPEFLALCGYFCMEPIACTARDPESKGTVEAKVRYVKHNALAGGAAKSC